MDCAEGFDPPLGLAMGIQGMEVIAIAVVILLFFLVLKQFGIWEPLSLEGKLKVTFNLILQAERL